MERPPIFRKGAIDRLSSPEQLDQVMRVTHAQSWIALAGIGTILATAIVWSITGSIPTKVQAQGILIKPGGVFDIYATGRGRVSDLLVKEGDVVKEGQIVARIEQPDLVRQIENGKAQLAELRLQHRHTAAYADKDLSVRTDAQGLQRRKLEATIAFAEARIKTLNEQIAGEERLLAEGLITRHTILQTQHQVFRTSDELEQARNELKQLVVVDLTSRTGHEQEIARSQLRINEAERNIGLLERQLDLLSRVPSSYAGRILEVKVDRGDMIDQGGALASLQLAGGSESGLEAVIYVPPSAGKSVRPGMAVQLSPSTAPRQEYGFLLGTVTYVSEFPSTPQGMMRVLANTSLVDSLSGRGAPFAVYADLAANPDSPNGYRWSSPRGETLKVNSGTICTVTITTRQRRPIDLVIPLFREYTGL